MLFAVYSIVCYAFFFFWYFELVDFYLYHLALTYFHSVLEHCWYGVS
jgi:hypothetical protein